MMNASAAFMGAQRRSQVTRVDFGWRNLKGITRVVRTLSDAGVAGCPARPGCGLHSLAKGGTCGSLVRRWRCRSLPVDAGNGVVVHV